MTDIVERLRTVPPSVLAMRDAADEIEKLRRALNGRASATAERATAIPIAVCGLSVACGRDGTWLHFTSSVGKSASLNVENMARGDGIIAAALRAWCADRQRQAEQMRAGDELEASKP
mgnify:FL=1